MIINPIEEKNKQISQLKAPLEENETKVHDMSAIKESLVKTRQELMIAKKASNLAKSKIDFARKVTEQRMSNCLSDPSPDVEDEIVSLYSTLVDEDSFMLENETLHPEEDFLKEVENKLLERGNIPDERSRLNQVRNKILDKVKNKKMSRQASRERRESMSSVGSASKKRTSGCGTGGDSSRLKNDSSVSCLPKLIK